MPSEAAELLLLDAADVQALLSHELALSSVREAFALHAGGQGRVFPLVREPLAAGAVFGVKSGDIAGSGTLGLKAAGFWPGNPARGLATHQATVLLVDPATGRARALVEGNAITAMRTGAAGALGLGLLARADSRRLCLFGSGVQARVQLDFALRVRPSLQQVRYLTASGEPDAGFEAAFAGRCETVHATDANASVAAADIVVTATPGRAVLFAAEALAPGAHLNAVGADTRGKRELPEGLLPRAELFADDIAQARQVGELQWAPAAEAREIGSLLAAAPGAQPWRRGPRPTVFDLTGLALQDLAVAESLCRQAQAEGRGRRVPWPS